MDPSGYARKEQDTTILNNILNKLSSVSATVTGSLLNAVGQLKEEAKAFVDDSSKIWFFPKSSTPQLVTKFEKAVKGGTYFTVITNIADLSTVWTEDKGNTTGQKIVKSGMKITGAVSGIGLGAVNITLLGGSVAAVPATRGKSIKLTGEIFVLDVAEAQGINWVQTKLLDMMNIK